MNLIDKFCTWYLTKKQKSQQQNKKQVEDKKLEEAYKMLRDLYGFVKFLNGTFRSRKEKKTFWRNVEEAQEPLIDTLDHILISYGVKSETIKKIDEERALRRQQERNAHLKK